MSPLISLVTVAYNAQATIADTMASVAAQAFDDYEHLVLDGGSTDATLDKVRQNATAHTRVVSEPDDGIYDAMNKGWRTARGRYVGFLNADDFLVRTDALALLADALRDAPDAVSPGVAIVQQKKPGQWVRGYSATHFQPWMIRFGHMPPHPTFLARRDLFEAEGGFDTRYRVGADFEWMVRFFKADRRWARIGTTLVAVREGGVSNQGLRSRRIIAEEALLALRRNGVSSSRLLVWSKYLAKSMQLVIAPKEFPAPRAVRWAPPE